MIREANKEDYEYINNFLEKMNTKVTIKDILNNPFSKIYVYDNNNLIIGMLIISKYYERMELDYIYILEKYRRLGYASQFLSYIIEKNKDIKNITLEVSEENISAIKLYQKFGFKIVAQRMNYYSNGIDAYLMERK